MTGLSPPPRLLTRLQCKLGTVSRTRSVHNSTQGIKTGLARRKALSMLTNITPHERLPSVMEAAVNTVRSAVKDYALDYGNGGHTATSFFIARCLEGGYKCLISASTGTMHNTDRQVDHEPAQSAGLTGVLARSDVHGANTLCSYRTAAITCMCRACACACLVMCSVQSACLSALCATVQMFQVWYMPVGRSNYGRHSANRNCAITPAAAATRY